MNKQLGWAALVLCALATTLIAALTALHDPIPEMLNLIAIGALTGGASLAVPGATETVRTSSSTSPGSARPTGAAAVPAPRPAPSSTSGSSLL